MVLRRLRLYRYALTVDDDRLILQHCVARAIDDPRMRITFTREFFPNRHLD
jgi:hypothetical protein